MKKSRSKQLKEQREREIDELMEDNEGQVWKNCGELLAEEARAGRVALRKHYSLLRDDEEVWFMLERLTEADLKEIVTMMGRIGQAAFAHAKLLTEMLAEKQRIAAPKLA